MALSVGVVGGFVLGVRESLLTLEANAFVQPAQYFFAYVAVPVLAWMALGPFLLAPAAVIRRMFRRTPEAGASLGFYWRVFGLAGGLSITLPWVNDIRDQMAAVGFETGLGTSTMLYGLATGLAGCLAIVIGAAAALAERRVRQLLRVATPALLATSVLLMVPIVQFLGNDWRWPASAGERSASRAERPNIVLISIDTLRADHLGAYGAPDASTPRLDEVAREGVVFEQTITSSPWTLPAMASLFTGLYPRHHGAGRITNRRDPLGRAGLSSDTWTVTAALQQAGYVTQAIVSNPYLALRYGFGAGFDGYENLTIESEFFLAGAHVTIVRLLGWLRPDLLVGDRGNRISAAAVRWLQGVDPTRPFFLWLHYVDPHAPYSLAGVTAHKTFRGDSLLGARGPVEKEVTAISPDVARLRSGEVQLSAAQKDAVRQLYQAEVTNVDTAVGTVLEALERRDLAQRTLVVIVGDHGEEFWEHGGVEHGHTVYDEIVKVPFLIRLPGVLPAGARVPQLVRITDVAPTVLELANIEPPATLDGESTMPLIRGTDAGPRVAVIETLLFAEERIGLRTAETKYVLWDNGKEEAFDLRDDPSELRDRSALGNVVRPMRELFARVGAPSPSIGPAVADTDFLALRALGYVR